MSKRCKKKITSVGRIAQKDVSSKLRNAVDDFLSYILERGLSINTRSAYELDTRKFLNFLAGTDIQTFDQVSKIILKTLWSLLLRKTCLIHQ